MPEAATRKTADGTKVSSAGWFVVNLDDVNAKRVPPYGVASTFEAENARFPHFGINVHVLEPGEPNGLYHSESAQEAFLVLAGECILVIDEQERPLRQWDFVHCPPETPHILVGAGDSPCAILMVGARGDEHTIHYPVSAAAGRYSASVREATDDAGVAYGGASERMTQQRLPWPPGRAGGARRAEGSI